MGVPLPEEKRGTLEPSHSSAEPLTPMACVGPLHTQERWAASHQRGPRPPLPSLGPLSSNEKSSDHTFLGLGIQVLVQAHHPPRSHTDQVTPAPSASL